MYVFFFFSSRRRHTRWPRDWSSDVCSSDLSEVTGRIEEADRLFRAASSGQILDPNLITGEIGSLLDLAGRLDKSGRFGEELELMRSVNGLAALGLRWLELIRALRALLR